MNYVIQVSNLNFHIIKKSHRKEKEKNRSRITKIKILKDIIKNFKNLFETLIKEVKTLTQNLLEIEKLNKLATSYVKQLKC